MLAKFGPATILNTALIQRVEATNLNLKTGRPQCKITLADDTSLIVPCSIEDAERYTGQVVPAPAGYSVIQAEPPEGDETEPCFTTHSVIAFRVMGDTGPETSTMPITPVGEPRDHWALIYPDGRCDALWDQTFSSVDAFKANFPKFLALMASLDDPQDANP